MQLTLHLTNKCNLGCKYCFVRRGVERMTKEIAFKAIQIGMQGVKTSGILFYGGEPLLERQLIYDIVTHTQQIKKETGHNFFYKMTTNGTLLDEDFLKFAKTYNITIGLSHDGPAQDDCRRFLDGTPSFAHLEDKIALLIKYQPYAIGMSVTDPSTVHKAAAMMQFWYDKGFRYLHLSHNYCRTAPWTGEHLDILRGEYNKMAEMYIKWTKAEHKFYLSPFDAKILSHLKGEKYNADRLLMAMNQPSITPDGRICYSSKYLDNEVFEIGNVFDGLDKARRKVIFDEGNKLPPDCQSCAIRTRCNYGNDSLVADDNGGITTDVSPMQCAHEQLITPIADYAAETLYKGKSALFIQKHYNELYPIMSLVEDMAK
ncbi:MAG: radical SAM protein [Oscillospiraceae bacterium]|nr:radical SAM protein [Oscillospiraceae bacterium]